MKIKYTIEIEEVEHCGTCPFNYDGCGCCISGKSFVYNEEDDEEYDIPKDCPLQKAE